MWGLISSLFLGLYFLMIFYIGRRGWVYLAKATNGFYQKAYWFAFGLLVLLFPIAEMGEDYLPESLGVWLTIWGGYSMVAVVYIFLLLLFIDSFRLLDKGLGFIPNTIKKNHKTPKAVSFLVIWLVILILVFGAWNARNPTISNYDLTINKKANSTEQLKIALVSDIHFGAIVDSERLAGMVEIMQEIKPDIVLIAGDIVEGTVGSEEAKKLIDSFLQIETKHGIFAVPGNHDRWARNDSALLHQFRAAGIKVLKDEQVQVAESFYIVGRDDLGRRDGEKRKDLKVLMQGVDTSLPVILLDHQPIDLQAAQENQVDLQVSGHTHVGQVFPSNLITGQIYELDWGLLKKGNYHLVVSSGYGTWGPPLRIGNNPEVVLINVNFN